MNIGDHNNFDVSFFHFIHEVNDETLEANKMCKIYKEIFLLSI